MSEATIALLLSGGVIAGLILGVPCMELVHRCVTKLTASHPRPLDRTPASPTILCEISTGEVERGETA